MVGRAAGLEMGMLAKRRKGRWLGIGLFAAVVVAVAVLAPRFVLASGDAERELAQRIRALTGADVAIGGPVRFSVLPRTRLVADHVEIGPAIGFSVDRIVADLDPVDALFGKATIARIVLIRPEYRPAEARRDNAVAVETGLRPAGPVSPSIEGFNEFERLARAAIKRLDKLQVLEVRDGVWRPTQTGISPNGFSNANFTVARTSDRSAVRVDGSFIWNGQPADLDMSIASTANLEQGGASAVSFSLATPPLSANFDGTLDFSSLRRLEGRLSIAGDSFSRMVAWLADPQMVVPELGSIALNGDMALAGSTLAFGNAALSIAGSTGQGAMEFDLDRRRLSGTLAYPSFDFGPIARAVVPPPTGPFNLRRPIDVAFSEAIDLNIRLSAGEALIGSLPLQDVAAVIGVSDGKATLDVGDASLFGGSTYGRIALINGKTPGLAGHWTGSGIDMGRLVSRLGDTNVQLTGQGQFDAELSANARDWETILSSAQLKADLTVHNGVVSGFDPKVFSKAGTQPLMAGLVEGTMPFTRMEAEFSSHGPRMSIDALELKDQSGVLTAHGRVSLADRWLQLSGHYEEFPLTASAGTQGDFTPSPPVSFILEGGWPNPSVVTKPSKSRAVR